MLSNYRFLITCEHASPAIPSLWIPHLEAYCEGCETHQIWDPGTSEIGSALGKLFRTAVFKGEFTRLLVDLNRSINQPDLFAPPLYELSERERTRILTTYYFPFRHQVISALDYLVADERPVIHISVHSFTPDFNGEKRTADFGLLFDPGRIWERELGEVWLHFLKLAEPDLVCRPNYPYKGTSDGHTTALRRSFGRHGYIGIELEFNQQLPLVENSDKFARWIYRSLERALAQKRILRLLSSPGNSAFA